MRFAIILLALVAVVAATSPTTNTSDKSELRARIKKYHQEHPDKQHQASSRSSSLPRETSSQNVDEALLEVLRNQVNAIERIGIALEAVAYALDRIASKH